MEISESDRSVRGARPSLAHNRVWAILLIVFNAIAFIASLILFIGSAYVASFRPTFFELAVKYRFIMSPMPTTLFILYPIIYCWELAFIIYQLVPRVGLGPYIQYGVSIWWMCVSVFQILSVYAWIYQQLWVALVNLVLLWISIAMLNNSVIFLCQIAPPETRSRQVSWSVYWLIQAPFALHWGLVTMLLVYISNVMCIAEAKGQLAIHLAATILSLGVLCTWNFFSFWCIPESGVWHCAVMSWCLLGTVIELYNPKGSLVRDYPMFILYGVWLSVVVVFAMSVMATVATGVNNVVSKLYTRSAYNVLWAMIAEPLISPRHEDGLTYYHHPFHTQGDRTNPHQTRNTRSATG
eukprot:GHVN01030727.1.p1 GENE.GHVN01030727.1~~GHVN01030727.1.p1  ORF type:complete len:352 (+),score=19.83 GHVN01030727.1:177-1232(+)